MPLPFKFLLLYRNIIIGNTNKIFFYTDINVYSFRFCFVIMYSFCFSASFSAEEFN